MICPFHQVLRLGGVEPKPLNEHLTYRQDERQDAHDDAVRAEEPEPAPLERLYEERQRQVADDRRKHDAPREDTP